ncbi:hypothetical protein LCGC14_2720280 [marine sediment metagenome]|uniref:Uncharacterized protein n=1 Tax=marine sediment metagenome TaxID=412755 RepID=A0A0F9C202_9ZZZZ
MNETFPTNLEKGTCDCGLKRLRDECFYPIYNSFGHGHCIIIEHYTKHQERKDNGT